MYSCCIYWRMKIKVLDKQLLEGARNDNLHQFESDLYDMVQDIASKKIKSNCQMQLPNDVKNIRKNPKLLIAASKTNNLYEFTTAEYNKMLLENVSKKGKKLPYLL